MLRPGSHKGFDPTSCCARLLEALKPYLGTEERPASTSGDLTPEQEREYRRCKRSFRYFLQHHVFIADGGGTKFDPWRWQIELSARLPGIRRLILLKARQLGLSWIAAAYALWVGLFHRGALVLLVSQTEPDAIELLAKVQFIFDHLPEYLQPARVVSRVQLLKFCDSYSAIVALPSTRRAGRGRTAKLVVADEHAFHQYAAANFAALSPTIDAGGQFLIVSTADGVGNPFAELCGKATQTTPWVIPANDPTAGYTFGRRLREAAPPEDGWLPIFLPYDARPGRDAAWWERKKESYLQPWMIHQEYPRDPDEAFVQTGRPVFDKAYLDRHRSRCADPIPLSATPFPDWDPAELRVFALPEHDHRYGAGADVAQGLDHGDYSALCLFDFDAPDGPAEVLTLHGHWTPDVFAEKIHAIAERYWGVYAIERNNHGIATVLACERLGTPGLFRERPILDLHGVEIRDGWLGWATTKTSKPMMIDEWEEALRLFAVRLSDTLSISEHVFYQTLPDGKTSAPSGKWDDRVIAMAIAWQMRKHLAQIVEAPGRRGSRKTTFSAKTAW